MNITASNHSLSGKITVPGSKSHTIRALILATLADGVSEIKILFQVQTAFLPQRLFL